MKIENRPMIPLAFALLCLVGTTYGLLGIKKTLILEESVRIDNLEIPRSLEPLELNPEQMYTLRVDYPTTFPVGGQIVVGATMLDAEGNELFELEDAYWRETGTWHEGGESGSWDEQNSKTEFNFRVPEAGTFSPALTVYDARGIGVLALRARILKSDPRPVGPAPFALGALIFLAMAGFVAYRRTPVTRKYLEKLGPGSKLMLRNQLFTVVDVREHAEMGETPGMEIRLQNHLGEERFVAIESYEKEWVDSEGDDRTRDYRYMLLELPLSPDEQAMLEQQKQQRWIQIRGETLNFDANNSGSATLTTTFEGESYRSRYYAQVFMPSTFPTEHSEGALILERVTYEERPEDEWSLMQILTWHDIEILDIQPRA